MNYHWNWKIFWETSPEGAGSYLSTLASGLGWTLATALTAWCMGDREFIGDAWMAFLHREKIPFILRLRENQHVLREGYAAMPLRMHDSRSAGGQTLRFLG